MPVHLRRQKQSIVLPLQPTATVPPLVAELAELLVATHEASQDEVAQLRLGVKNGSSIVDISESAHTLGSLKISDASVVLFKFADESWGYEEYAA